MTFQFWNSHCCKMYFVEKRLLMLHQVTWRPRCRPLGQWLHRVRYLISSLLAVASILGAAPHAASAQGYPSQFIKLVHGYTAGSAFDIIVRYYAGKLHAITGQSVIVEPKPGALNNIATEYVARAKPDGYTILIASDSILANMHRFKEAPVDVPKALIPLATVFQGAFMLTVDSKQPWKSANELTAYLKSQKDGKASYGVTTFTTNVIGELYKKAGGFEATEVLYKNSRDTIGDMASGNVTFTPLNPVDSLAFRDKGQLRILAVFSGARTRVAPDIPTMEEATGIAMDLRYWGAAFVPAGTPPNIVETVSKWFSEVVALDEADKFLRNGGNEPFQNTLAQSQALMMQSLKNWGEWVRAAKIQQM